MSENYRMILVDDEDDVRGRILSKINPSSGFDVVGKADNRPLNFSEFEERVGQVLYTTATPGKYELEKTEKGEGQIVEQVIRPTGLLDPEIDLRPVNEKGNYPGQVKDFIAEAEKIIKTGSRVLTTTLTKKMAEDLSEFLEEKGIKTKYIHSDVDTVDRIEILTDFRKGEFDCLVGVNLLREGLDLPRIELPKQRRSQATEDCK